MVDLTEARAIGDYAQQAMKAQELNGVPYVTLPDGHMIAIPDTEKYEPNPRRKRGEAVLREAASFKAYVIRHATEASVIFADIDCLTFHAILDHHEGVVGDIDCVINEGKAGWASHTATLQLTKTRQWIAWMSLNQRVLSQEQFADFIDERITEIAEPEGAKLAEMVRNLHIRLDTTWENVINPYDDTVKLVWKEEMKTGTVEVPRQLQLVMAPLEGTKAVTITAKLKINKPNAQGKVGFVISFGDEARQALELEFAAALGEIAEATKVPVFQGHWS